MQVPVSDCGGELPRRRSVASVRSSTAGSTVWARTGARALTATWRRTISQPRRPASRRGSGFASCCADGIRTLDDPLFRPIDADDFPTNGENASDFSVIPPERPREDHVHAAAEHQARRSRHHAVSTETPVGRGARFRRSTTWRSQERTAASRGRAARTTPVDISWMLA